MQSSATVACRAGVMLVCLIAIPLAALFGTKLPDLAKGLLAKEWDLSLLYREWDLSGLWCRDTPTEAPPFGPSVSTAPWSDRPGSGNLGGIPSHWQAAPPAEARPSPTARALYESPIEGTSPHSPHAPSEGVSSTALAADPGSPKLVPVAMPGQAAGSASRAGYFSSVAGAQAGGVDAAVGRDQAQRELAGCVEQLAKEGYRSACLLGGRKSYTYFTFKHCLW